MSSPDLFSTAARLQDAGVEYALVTVVRAEAPASARPGDKAVVTAEGTIHGWVGGGCAQPAVVKTVRQALADGKARVIRIAPSSEGEHDLGDVLEFGMACHSGGTLELFVDPMLPRPQLLIFGYSPVALAMAQLAPRVGFAVDVAAHGALASDFPDARRVFETDDVAQLGAVAAGAYIVVATQGRRDLQALRAALALDARQVSFVASARKASVLKASLIAGGADAAAVEAIVAPAGYPIAASTPEEIALSVLAALVADRRSAKRPMVAEANAEAAEAARTEAPARSRVRSGATAEAESAGCCGSADSAPEPVSAPVQNTGSGGSCCGG
jgi:xanthine dehydrogenase accessory factor